MMSNVASGRSEDLALSGRSTPRSANRRSPEGREREFPATRVGTPDQNNMGGAEDNGSSRYYHPSQQQRCSAAAANQLGQSRDFHYTVQDHHYRPSRSTREGAAVVYHSPHGSTGQSSRTRTGSREYYLDPNKASPYHGGTGSGTVRTGIRGVPSERAESNYMLLRQAQRHQQHAAAEFERLQHHSGSRSDLLDHDHNALYDHAISATSYGGAGPAQQYSFVRTCDGKFVRTSIPIHEFDALMDGSGYYRSTVNHTLRRPSKRHTAAPAATDGYGQCCPSRGDDLPASMSRSMPSGSTQSYATLRGRKWTEKQRAGCTSQGIGDNYGRSGQLTNYLDDGRSVASFTDDYLAIPPPHHEAHVASSRDGSRIMSRSTDRNLDNVGLSDEEMLLSSASNVSSVPPMRTSEEVLSLLTREPPDGKEKPEPSKTSLHKMETLSRKSSKCDLLSAQVMQQGQDCRSEVTSACGDTASVLGGNVMAGHPSLSKTDSGLSMKRDSLSSAVLKDGNTSAIYLDGQQQQEEMDSGISSMQGSKEWKTVPGGPRCPATSIPLVQPPPNLGLASTASSGSSSATSPKSAGLTPPANTATPSSGRSSVGVATRGSLVQYSSTPPTSSTTALTSHSFSQPLSIQESVRNFGHLLSSGTAKFFGVEGENEDHHRLVWTERRRRLAIKRFGGVKDEFNPGYHADSAYSQYNEGCSRLRYDHHLTSEMEGDKMVLKISKPPRSKDSLTTLTGQTFSWLLNSMMMTRKIPSHPVVSEHEVSRSYQPSTTGIAAYYQAEQSGGLAVCPPLPRVPSTHHLHGESPAEEVKVFFTKPTATGCDGDELVNQGKRMVYSSDPYRSCSWQLPRPDADFPRMSSDVGASRIWNRLLDSAFDNSDRRKHGMGLLGRLLTKRRAVRRSPESNRKRKLGGNAGDHRPYFTYWMTFVQIFVLLISIMSYGIGPIGIDLYKTQGMVLEKNLELEQVSHLEPANFWIGPAARDLIHLGAKYAPCMRWDETVDREIKDERLKERDTACCIRKDRAGCVQSDKSSCAKFSDIGGGTPRLSNWWRPSEWSYPNENRRSSGPVCGLDPAYCEAPASVAPYIWPDDITKWPICRKKTELSSDQSSHTAEHMICEIIGHPCCIGIRGHCQITTREYCEFVKGTFHDEAALCSQVICMSDVCGLLPFRDRDVPDQFYRTWTPLFLHAGVLHLALTVVLQYWLMRDLEKLAGASRIAIIYLGSGMVGNLASAIFVPYRAEVGPAGAHFGLLACCMVEVIHQWPMLKYPEMAILKLVGITAVFFLTGLLPWIDNYAHLFGFIFGFLLSYALLPFVTFGVYDRRKKIILIWICVASMLFLFVGLLLLFYVTPIHDCEVCKYFNCIPITKDFCADQSVEILDKTNPMLL